MYKRQIQGGPTIFTSAEAFIKNDSLPLSIHVYRNITRCLFNLGLTSIVAVFVFFFYGQSLKPTALLAFPALALMLINAVWVQILIGIICTRHRDFAHLLQTVMRFMFFLTPIFWLPEQMGGLMKVLWWNPFYHFIEILRAPLLDGDMVQTSWLFVSIVTVLGSISTLVVFALTRRRIVFWF